MAGNSRSYPSTPKSPDWRAFAIPRADPHQWISPSASGGEGSGGVQLTTLTRLAVENALPLEAAVAVGDGANDLHMIKAAGLGVAFRAKPVVVAAARGWTMAS